MATDASYVIVGASLGGAKAAETIRAEGFDGPLIMIGSENELPYERPPLSKEYLRGKAERDSIFTHPRDWYADANIDLRLGTTVTGIDRAAHQVTLSDGNRLGYAKLLLTTGSSPRHLLVPGHDLEGVLYLRTVGDSERIKAAISEAARVAVIGGGWIGLEVTAAAREAGVAATVVETAELPLLNVLGREVAQVFADLHLRHEVDLRLGAGVAEITGTGGRVTGVRLGDGGHVAADAVIGAIGITPNVELAQASGLDVANGITVDAQLRSSDPDIYAAGDVASAFHPLLGKHIRVEHWANALNQPQAAARAMLGQAVTYDRIPYFFTDQYELGMEYSGYVEPDGYSEVVFRGDVAGLEFLAFWLADDDRVLAGMNVNIWDVNETIQALVRARRPVDKAALRDPSVPLESLTS
jgi:3-phenylpropionate/trans-cinnamate dioxygenase ferredoxin reductase component